MESLDLNYLEKNINANCDKRIIIFHNNNSFIYFFIKNNRIYNVRYEDSSKYNVGDILICKVYKWKPEINGWFVKLSPNDDALLLAEDNYLEKNIKNGDEIIVRVKKEAYENKVPRVTTKLELNGGDIIASFSKKEQALLSYSKKLTAIEKDAIKGCIEGTISQNLADNNISVLFRTDSAKLAKDKLLEDLDNTVDRLKNIINKGAHSVCYTLLYKNDDYLRSLINDYIKDDNFIVIANDKLSYEKAAIVISDFKNGTLSLYENDIPIQTLYGLKNKLNDITSEKIWLKSGGYLFIEKTRAFTVIDVNLGKSEHKKSSSNKYKEESILNINIESAIEIAYQIEARNLSGIIIVDFINMKDNCSKTILIETINKHLSAIKPKAKLVDITKLGLAEITREKIYSDIYEIKEIINKTILL